MKLIFSFSFLILFLSHNWTVAQTAKDIFNSSKTEIVFLGLDFTYCNMVGSEGFTDPQAIVSRIMPAWNNLFITEKEKYNLAKTFMKGSFEYAIDHVRDRNAEIDFLQIVSDDPADATHLDEADISRIVSKYKLNTHENIGLVFIMESFDKLSTKGNMWVTFINTRTNEVLFTERMSGKAGGAGMRNYWIRTVYNVLMEIQKKRFKIWQKEYGSF